MKVKFIVSSEGITNSGRAVDGDSIHVEKLMEMENLSHDALLEEIMYGAKDESSREIVLYSIAQSILNVMEVAGSYNKQIVK